MKRSITQWVHLVVWMAGISLLCACAPQRPPLQPPLQPVVDMSEAPVLPSEYYRQAEAKGGNILRVDTRQSLVLLEVRRAGPFAHLGHDHVVASHDVSGFVAPEALRADLSVPLDKLVVDEKALRQQAGFDTQPTAEDIAGTRHNMLVKVLESQRYPLATIHITKKTGADSETAMLDVMMTLHGVTRTFSLPSTMQSTANGMIISGTMHFKQSDFGIVPFSILNGAIRVQDELTLRFRIVADRR